MPDNYTRTTGDKSYLFTLLSNTSEDNLCENIETTIY